MKNTNTIMITIILVVAISLIGIPLLVGSEDSILPAIGIAILMISLVLYLRNRMKNKLLFAHVGAAILLAFLWYMDNFTDSPVSYWAIVLLVIFIWIFYFWEWYKKKKG